MLYQPAARDRAPPPPFASVRRTPTINGLRKACRLWSVCVCRRPQGTSSTATMRADLSVSVTHRFLRRGLLWKRAIRRVLRGTYIVEHEFMKANWSRRSLTHAASAKRKTTVVSMNGGKSGYYCGFTFRASAADGSAGIPVAAGLSNALHGKLYIHYEPLWR